jgi:flavin reductase (DIM6/NTAB) family NADH-FMN oxidoreductase RutF
LGDYNMMTASWGGVGVLWSKCVAFAFVRPSRLTFEFMEREKAFALSFFPEGMREALNVCGTMSGRDGDKAKAAGLTPMAAANGATTFREAKLVLECRKLYWQDLGTGTFLDPSIADFYHNDYHRMYVGEISRVDNRGEA